MLRQLARSALAHGLDWTGALAGVRRLSGAAREPLILGYHRVRGDLAEPVPPGVPGMIVSARTLERHLDFVGRHFQFVSLDELGARIEAGSAEGLAAVTFDDGYADFHEHAFPLLCRKGIPAAVFVVTDVVDAGGAFLHDRLFGALEVALREWGAAETRSFLGRAGCAVPRLQEQPFPATRQLIRSIDQRALAALCGALESQLDCAPTARSLSWDQLASME